MGLEDFPWARGLVGVGNNYTTGVVFRLDCGFDCWIRSLCTEEGLWCSNGRCFGDRFYGYDELGEVSVGNITVVAAAECYCRGECAEGLHY